jgi:predicted HicB family RNase H-like nuclease
MVSMKTQIPPNDARAADSARYNLRVNSELLQMFGEVARQRGVSKNSLIRDLIYQTVAESHKATANQ